MSIWGNIREKSLGQSARLEEQTEEIKKLSKYILDRVVEHNDLVNDVVYLTERCCSYKVHGFPLFYTPSYQHSHCDSTVVNATLKSRDYEKMKELGRKLFSAICKLKKEKEVLERKIKDLENIEREQREILIKKIEQEQKEEEEKKRKEKEAEDKRLTVKFFINVAVSILIAVAAGLSCAQNGEPVWGGALISGVFSFFAGLFIIGKSENF